MTKSLSSLILAGALAACSHDTAHNADQAADRLVDKTDDLRAAQDEFATHRQVRVDALAAEHSVIATQPIYLQSLASALPLTDIGRSDVTEKLTVFQMRLDDAAHAIESLQAAPPDTFTQRDDAASKSMTRLEDSRQAAWKTLASAPRIDRTGDADRPAQVRAIAQTSSL